MASEYWKWKFKDVQPDEKQELTPEEKRRNWWHYHKWHIALGVVLAVFAGSLIWQILGIGEVEPDYRVAYVGSTLLPDDTVAALEAALSALGEDLNGDGQTVVSLRQYASGGEADLMGTTAATAVQLMADIVEGESYFFLLEDPEQFQQAYHALRRLDGTLPEEDASAEGTSLPWDACPVLRQLDLGGYTYVAMGQTVEGDSQELLSGLSFARRGYWTEEDAPYPEGCDALWERLTEGAVS